MENSSKFQLQRTLSIQSCFQESNYTPASAHAEEPNLNITGITSHLTISAPFQIIRNQTDEPEGTKSPRNLVKYVPLYHAALKGDWETAKEFFGLYPQAITATITEGYETVLHVAAGAKQVKFVEELVKLMDPSELAIKNKYENTALCFAVVSGIKGIAEVMVAKNNDLPRIRGSNGVTPLHIAALLGYRDMVWYLSSVTDSQYLTKEDYVALLLATISSDLFDVALKILEHKPELAIERDPNGETALHVLARKPSAFSGKSELGIWQRCVYPCLSLSAKLLNKSCCTSTSRHRHSIFTPGYLLLIRLLKHVMDLMGIQEVIDKEFMSSQALELVKFMWRQFALLDDSEIGKLLRSPSRPLFVAAEFGNFQFIRELILSYPDLIWKVDEQSRSIFHIAVIHRQEKIFRLLYDIGAHKELITSYKNTNNCNMLHLAANLAPPNRLKIVSGAALQMQRELLWFKEVENNMQPLYKEMKDSEGRTPQMLFTEEHKGLVKSGEKWMKDTASSCMLVATLITTVMFAAIFTVPGGNNNNTGTPIFLNDKSFIIFSISDALALFSSVTSILMFLSILTSRYAEEDFLESLPKRLIIGLTTLFFSIALMLIAFSASFFIVVGHHLAWIIVPVALTACIPVTLFAFLQFPLLADVLHSTYRSGIFAMEHKDRLY
ncbi:Ankyrin repeat family protein [Abeliophyllum distichum]|uniref:Ankyrin repeat family protein n=1 Tax=Abeliophyllum distichum TaxID=126358 RepID=A0ABD1QET8_9LAMI